MTDLELNLPGNRSKYPPRNHVIATLHALPTTEIDHNDNKMMHFRYGIAVDINNNNLQQKYLQVYPGTGEIMFSDSFFSGRKFIIIYNLSIEVHSIFVLYT